ncbi:MAG: ATPase, T2SS/T4P/T4SS family [Syntrophorhabdaceae bacterium]|nr:ATPase, T2SS/T4P/T4SS family [Syntrophorhabdaceae bacterium]
MKANLILEFTDGRREEGALIGNFMPEQNVIKAILMRTGMSHTFFLNTLCAILMQPPKDFKVPTKDLTHEIITTVTGKRYNAAVIDEKKYQTGFYAISAEMDNPFRLLFFPSGGVKLREKESPIGTLLKDKGFVTDFEIEKVLKEQQDLREKKLGEIIAKKEDVPQEAIEKVIESAYKGGKVTPRMKVGDILVEAGLVTKEQVEDAISHQQEGKKKKIGTLLIEKGLITEKQLLNVLAVKFLLRFVDLDQVTPKKKALEALPVDVIKSLKVLPIDDDGKKLVVATSEPTDYTIPDTLRFYTKRKVELVVATSKQISEAIKKYFPEKEEELKVEDFISGLTEKLVIEEEPEEPEVSETDSQIVSLVNKIMLDAYNKGASDIHFEPGYRDAPFQVRYRIDGVCSKTHEIPKMYKRAIISRIKIMANLDISERRKPQSGKIVMWHQGRQIEFRVEITPTIGANEDAVLRILNTGEPLPLESMGFSDFNLEILKNMLKEPFGMILCVGPTGSGKTTTLHSILKALNTPDVKIWTVEDPVEITQKGLRQVQVLPKIGLTFQEVLRSFLRADPDIIMVGEMRDVETAKTVIEASLTGHLVLSTLHTNNAPETINRLIEMGMDPFNFADALLGIIAQRLIRRLCEKCKEPYHPKKEEYEHLVNLYGSRWFYMHDGVQYSDKLTFMRRKGCGACNNTGYKGRLAVHELLFNSENIKHLITQKASSEQIRVAALAVGMRTLIMDGIQKIFLGLTDMDEVLQACRYEKNNISEINYSMSVG